MLKIYLKYFVFLAPLTLVSKAKAGNPLPIEVFEEPGLMIRDPWLLSVDAFLILGAFGWTVYLSFFPKGKFVSSFLRKNKHSKSKLRPFLRET